jgi:hypothetical protein
VPGALSSSSGLLATSPDVIGAVAWRIRSGLCAACGPHETFIPSSVTFGVLWFASPCEPEARVSIVAADTISGCTAPDTSRVLCGPVTQTLPNTGPASTLYTLTIPESCAVDREVFVLIRFIGMETCPRNAYGYSPGLGVIDTSCQGCNQYQAFPPDSPGLVDYCPQYPSFTPVWIEVDGTCRDLTATRSASWGALKTHYR